MSGFWNPAYPQGQQQHRQMNGQGPSYEAMANQLTNSFSSGMNLSDQSRMGSRLSFDAPVFVPKAGRTFNSPQTYAGSRPQTTNNHYQQQSYNNTQYYQASIECGNAYGNGSDQFQLYQNGQTDDSSVDAILPEFQTALQLLMQDPHNFDKVSYFTLNLLQNYVHSDSGIVLVVNMFFSHILQYGTHARSFAQLCSFLSEKYDGQDNANVNAAFTRLLLKRCYEEYSDKEAHMSDPEYQTTFDNFTLFITELYLQLKVNGKRVAMLRDFVRESMLYLLLRPNDDNCKTVAHLLNFCGPAMEADEKLESKGSVPEMDSLMTQVLSTAESPNLSPQVKNLLIDLRELRITWADQSIDRSAPSKNGDHNGQMMSMVGSNNGVYYHEPDGTPLTAEESEFLERNLNPGYLEDGEENEDDIIAEAYEQFLVMQEAQKAAKSQAQLGDS